MRVKPRKDGAARRRLLTISAYVASFVLLSVGVWIWLPLALLLGVFRRRSFVVLRLLVFAWFYFGCELIALMMIAWVFLTRRSGPARDDALYALQAWWASLNLRVAVAMLDLQVSVEGEESGAPGPAILLVRHASILDTLLPCTYVQRPHRFHVRYVLKQELLVDPCLDIVGHALPNYFIDRSGDRQRELAGVRALARDLGSDGLLIFPEGTRFSQQKRRRALERLEAEGFPWAAEARAMEAVLPPKPGGVLALLDALPGVDCVFVAHRGLEPFAKIASLLSGEIVGAHVDMKLWRVDGSEIPEGDDARLQWLYSEWSKVDRFVRNLLATK